ncbi:MAG: helix-turn-helix transcriptional regulator [Staphylococcus epidermidis]|uniref:helix-turn-helix transcriptional regulator n=1 Tax=Staphylococcaceae TaxID=90964 RepID=UPI0012469F43|nr:MULTISPECIES: helix-turn-helix transcriptional regulator [Staphylococcaceae]KAA9253905.1 helix-turn-helix transcriptional regulator [Staphylococcus epidermidis]MCO6315249.1 helix-turn-helix transcriptional regulator [Staphylococcus epidermidis]MCO6317724.1 helix-turn-helix transcriptional regulator [Staphylococcus epidermidis]MDU0851021.1 helix-turn-helix transcriptional regulator [Staphylococcus epidermidis]MDU0878051.1 helix-turn-helix transcriptional regulator [Staphylococcus epidermidis
MNIKSKTIKLKVELLKNGLSIVDLSKKVSIDPSYSNQIVNGKRNPSPKLAKRIAETLGVEITDIFTIEINKEAN